MRFELDGTIEQQWEQMDPAVLEHASSGGVHDPDLVLDVILRDRGQIDTFVTTIAATVEWKAWKPHRIPGTGLGVEGGASRSRSSGAVTAVVSGARDRRR